MDLWTNLDYLNLINFILPVRFYIALGEGQSPHATTAHLHWRSSHYAVTHVRNKNNIQGRSPNTVKMIFNTIRNCS